MFAMTTQMVWDVEGIQRTANIYQPDGVNLPVMFAFHGHGGTGKGFALTKTFESYWPEAIISVGWM